MDSVIYQQEKDAKLFGEDFERQYEAQLALRDFRRTISMVRGEPAVSMNELALTMAEIWTLEECEMYLVKLAQAVRMRYE